MKSRSQVLSRLISSATALRAAVTAIIALQAAAGASAATKTWDGGAGTSSWHTAANWDNDTLPVAGDDIVISVPGPVTVTYSTGSLAVNSITCTNGLTISGGTLTVNGASTIATLTLGFEGSLSGSGEVMVTGLLSWTRNTTVAAGSIERVSQSGVGNLSPPVFLRDGLGSSITLVGGNSSLPAASGAAVGAAAAAVSSALSGTASSARSWRERFGWAAGSRSDEGHRSRPERGWSLRGMVRFATGLRTPVAGFASNERSAFRNAGAQSV
jgi:hypothetical protein